MTKKEKEVFVKYSKDGKEIVGVTNESKIVIMNEKLEIKEEKKVNSPITSVDTSHQGNLISITCENGECVIWSRKKDKMWKLKCPISLKFPKTSFEFRGSFFALKKNSKKKPEENEEFFFTYQVYQSLKKSFISKWRVEEDQVFHIQSVFSCKFQTSLSVSPCLNFVTAGDSDGSVYVFDFDSLNRFMVSTPHKLFVSDVTVLDHNVFSVSGDRILYVSPLKKNVSSFNIYYFLALVFLLLSIIYKLFL